MRGLGSDPTKQLLKTSNLPFANDFLSLFHKNDKIEKFHLRMSVVCMYMCVYKCVYIYVHLGVTDERVKTCTCGLDANRN